MASKIDNYHHRPETDDARRKEEVRQYLDQEGVKYWKTIYNFAYSKIGNRAEDVVQIVFARINKHLQQPDAKKIESFIAYALETTRHVIADMLEEENRLGSNVQSLDDERNVELRNLIVDQRATRAITELLEAEDRLVKSMADATPLQRQMVALWREGMKRQEIADHLGLPLETVKIELNRFLAKLRHRLNH
ncbi:MAG TPA: sigma-70 family RNA polymerase sigma factor [Pyrinomonadaceae bacterium]|jgi:RNA polymerase sigma factor (sigma-70 family)